MAKSALDDVIDIALLGGAALAIVYVIGVLQKKGTPAAAEDQASNPFFKGSYAATNGLLGGLVAGVGEIPVDATKGLGMALVDAMSWPAKLVGALFGVTPQASPQQIQQAASDAATVATTVESGTSSDDYSPGEAQSGGDFDAPFRI